MGQFLELSIDVKAFESAVNRKLKRYHKQVSSEPVRDIAAERYKDAIEHYVPMRTGNLRASAKVMNGKIVYSARSEHGHKYAYASDQYHTPRPESVRFTSGTFDHWDKHLTNTEKALLYEQLAKDIAEVLNGRQE